MNDVIEHLRTRWPEPPPARPDAARRIMDGLLTGRTARTRRRFGRTALVGGVTAVAATALIGAVVILPRGGSTTSAAAVVPLARVDWGMDATVRLQPDSGVTIDDMRERFRTSLARRVVDRDGAGVEVLSAEDNRITVRFPGADSGSQIRSYLTATRLTILDTERGVIATGPNLTALEAAAKRHITSGTPVVYYVQQDGGPGLGLSVPERFTSVEGARAAQGSIGPGRVDLIAVPASFRVVGGGSGETTTVSLVRDVVAVPPSAVRDVQVDGRRVAVTVDPSSVPRPGMSVSVTVDDNVFVGTGAITADGQITVTTTESPTWADRMMLPDLGGTVEVLDATRFGSRPPLAGTPVPAPAEGFSDWRWTRVLTTRLDDRRVELLAGQKQGAITSLLTMTDGRVSAESGGGHGICGLGIGTPRVSRCGWIPGDRKRDGSGRLRTTVVSYGRVLPDVARVTAVGRDGTSVDAHIENGWFYVATSAASGPGAWTDDISVRAFDSDGAPVPIQNPMGW